MTLLLDNDTIEPLISASEFVDVLDLAYRGDPAGSGVCPPRIDVQSGEVAPATNYQLGLAVGLSGRYAALRIKSDVVFQRLVGDQVRKEKYCGSPGTYMGLVLVFDGTNGSLLAILHDGLIQKMRVGADSALGVRYMARSDAQTLGILGAGGMARAHVVAINAVRPLAHIRVFSPTTANRESFAREIRDLHGIEAEAVDSPEAVYRGADIVSSCASAVGPMIIGRHLAAGQHVTCIGGTLDAEANRRVDVALRFGNATAPVGMPGWSFEDECLTFAAGGRKAGHGGTPRFADIPQERRIMFADLLAEPSRGRRSSGQITFSERGNIHGVQFAAVAGLIYEKARAAGVGRVLDPVLFTQTIRN